MEWLLIGLGIVGFFAFLLKALREFLSRLETVQLKFRSPEKVLPKVKIIGRRKELDS